MVGPASTYPYGGMGGVWSTVRRGFGRHGVEQATLYGARLVALTQYDSDLAQGGAVVRGDDSSERYVRVPGVVAVFGEVVAPEVPGVGVECQQEPRVLGR